MASLASRLFERARDLARDIRDDSRGSDRDEALQAQEDAEHVEQLVALAREAVPHLPGAQRQRILRLLEAMGE